MEAAVTKWAVANVILTECFWKQQVKHRKMNVHWINIRQASLDQFCCSFHVEQCKVICSIDSKHWQPVARLNKNYSSVFFANRSWLHWSYVDFVLSISRSIGHLSAILMVCRASTKYCATFPIPPESLFAVIEISLFGIAAQKLDIKILIIMYIKTIIKAYVMNYNKIK